MFFRIRKDKEKAHAAGDSDNRRNERTPCNFFRCKSVDNLIYKFTELPKDNKKRQKQGRLKERGNPASQKECENSDNDNYQVIYSSMAKMSGNDKISSRYFGDS